MKQKQHGMKQQQYQGPERRQSQTPYPGEERRKPDPVFEEQTLPPSAANPGMQHDDTH